MLYLFSCLVDFVIGFGESDKCCSRQCLWVVEVLLQNPQASIMLVGRRSVQRSARSPCNIIKTLHLQIIWVSGTVEELVKGRVRVFHVSIVFKLVVGNRKKLVRTNRITCMLICKIAASLLKLRTTHAIA